MASTQEFAPPTTPLSVNRPPLSPRHGHSHSLSTTSFPTANRIQRRPSVSSPGVPTVNMAALAQAIRDGVDLSTVQAGSPLASKFPLVNSRPTPAALHGYPSPPASLPAEGAGPLSIGSVPNVGFAGQLSPGFTFPRRDPFPATKAASGLAGAGQFIPHTQGTTPTMTATPTTKRNRRASEGASALLNGEKPEKGELRCDKCGKGYKHGSCLTKHLWEHTPEWQITSKLLISKHQQVQLLEAASILVSMNPADTPPSTEGNSDSSTTGDSPPPIDASPLPTPISSSYRGPRARSGSKRLSRSFQPPSAFQIGSAPVSSGISKPRPRGSSFISTPQATAAALAAVSSPPPTSGFNAEDESLAAAVGLLSCSFRTGTPGSVPTGPMSPAFAAESEKRDVMMKIEEAEGDWRHGGNDDDMAVDDDDEWSESRDREGRSRSEEDEGVFGRMEE